MTYLLLPAITFVITKVISGNIALSLGMIGALSIVRFRNPVKNPLELVIFFALLTTGIAAGVALKWAVALTTVCLVMFVLMYYLEKFLTSIGRAVFSISFDEGNPAHVIEVTATKQIPQLDSSPSLQYSSHSNETGIYSYKLALRDRESARELDQALRQEDGVQQSLVRYSNYL
jgi:high-affinity Fe2+/Pb2+ permease